MLVAQDCSLPKENRPGHRPVASIKSFTFKKSYWIDSTSVSGLNYLRDHRVGGKIIYPAAGFSMAGIAVHQALPVAEGKPKPIVLEHLKFRRTLSLPDRDTTVLRLNYKPDRGEFTVHSDRSDDPGAMSPHAIGRLAAINLVSQASDTDFDSLFEKCCEEVDVRKFYQRLSRSGLDYGPFFKRIISARVSRHTGEAVTQLTSHPGLATIRDPWAQPITLLDSAFQSLAIALDTDKHHLYVPSRIRELRVYADFEPNLWCYTRILKSTNRAVVGDITLFNALGRPLIQIHGLLCLRIPRNQVAHCNGASELRDSQALRKNNFHQPLPPTVFRD
ncbi:MAG: polyketide synthase dehydratase domain-containing protein [bacterium]